MSRFDDDGNDVEATEDLLSDEAIEAFLTGRPDPAWERHAGLVAVDREVAAAVGRPAPAMGAELARLLAGSGDPARRLTVVPGTPTGPAVVVRRPAQIRPSGRHRRAMAMVVGGLAAVASALPVAAAAHVLPAPVHGAIVRVLETVTPFDFPKGPASVPGSAPVAPVAGRGDGPAAGSGSGTANGLPSARPPAPVAPPAFDTAPVPERRSDPPAGVPTSIPSPATPAGPRPAGGPGAPAAPAANRGAGPPAGAPAPDGPATAAPAPAAGPPATAGQPPAPPPARPTSGADVARSASVT
jgi:hypothetical protein